MTCRGSPTRHRENISSSQPATTTSRYCRQGTSSAQCLCLWLTCSLSRQGTIVKLSGDVLLNIFLHCLDASPQFWTTLVHVCQNWRQVVFTSPRTLHLRLYCKHGTLVLKTLGCWPVLPMVVQYGGYPTLYPLSPKDVGNVVAALNQSDRISSINLTTTSSPLEKSLFYPIQEPFSNLEDLVLSIPKSHGTGASQRIQVGLTPPSSPLDWGCHPRTPTASFSLPQYVIFSSTKFLTSDTSHQKYLRVLCTG